VDDGWTPIQSWKKNSVRNRPFRLSNVQEAFPRSIKQEDYLGTPNTAKKRQKKSQVKPMWVEKAQGIKLTPPHSLIFKSPLIFSKVIVFLRIPEKLELLRIVTAKLLQKSMLFR
jgi:hypothetical protein